VYAVGLCLASVVISELYRTAEWLIPVTGMRFRITTVAERACLKGNYKLLEYKMVVTGLFVF